MILKISKISKLKGFFGNVFVVVSIYFSYNRERQKKIKQKKITYIYTKKYAHKLHFFFFYSTILN